MPDPSPSRTIFISYRRDDAGGEAGRLFDDLIRAYGPDTVFMDVAGIEPGIDFRKAIDSNVASCGVLLAVIGPQWLSMADHPDGARRLDQTNDFVRLEIASALRRNIPVIPVLVHGAAMPHADALPEDLEDLAYRNAVELTLPRWNSDVSLLVAALRNYVHTAPGTAASTVHATVPVQFPAPESPTIDRTPRRRLPLLLGVAAAVLVLLVVAIFVIGHSPSSNPPASRVPVASAPQTQYQVPLPFNQVGIDTRGQQPGNVHFFPFVKMLAPGSQLMTVRDGTVFLIGPTGEHDIVQPSADRPTIIPLPAKHYSGMAILGGATNGAQPAQSFYVNYSTRSGQHVQGMSDVTAPDQPRFPGETLVLTRPRSQQPLCLSL